MLVHSFRIFLTEYMFLELHPQLCPVCSEECVSQMGNWVCPALTLSLLIVCLH